MAETMNKWMINFKICFIKQNKIALVSNNHSNNIFSECHPAWLVREVKPIFLGNLINAEH